MYKVLIVDDELVIREGLREILPWEEIGMEIVCAAESGESAYEYLSGHSVDILITDIHMEGMDGLTLIEKTREISPQIHCIILSGYDDFVYTKKAIQLGIENYILKPIDENELRETLCGIEDKLAQAQRGESVRDREKQVILQSVLARWLTGSIEETALRHRASFLEIPVDGVSVQACILRILSTANAERRQGMGMAFARAWRPIEDVWMQVCWDLRRDVVAVFSGDLDRHAASIRRQLEELVKHTGWARGEKFFAGLGRIQTDALNLSQSYRDARMVAELSLVLPESSVVEYKEQHFEEASEDIPKINFERLEQSIRAGRSGAVAELWDDWGRDMSRRKAEPRQIRNYAVKIMCRLIVLWTDSVGTQENGCDDQRVLEGLFAACTVAQLKKALQDFSVALAEKMKRMNINMNPSVRRVMEAVEKHYDQELTLRGLAEQYHVNPVYLGRMFKEETGQVFTAYLNQVRMREAKRLLTETDRSVASIAASVGYLSQGYFTNMFKKSVGCFPREYRMKQR